MKNFFLLNPRITTILITIISLQITACNTSGNNADSSAIISGIDSGSIIKNIDPDGDNLLVTTGKLNISSDNAEDAAFQASTVNGSYGSLTIDTTGNWNYTADNNQSAIQNLTADDQIIDELTVSSLDGTTSTISIAILGSDSGLINNTNNTTSDIALSWVAPAERENNSPITLSEIAGYKIYFGSTQGNYPESIRINDGNTVNYTFTDLSAGAYYFAITTIDTDGRESGFSAEVKKSI